MLLFCSVDATGESEYLGRLINHSLEPKLTTRLIEIDGLPHLVFFASKKIPAGIEITFDYNDKRRNVLAEMPWLRRSNKLNKQGEYSFKL